MSGVLWQSAGSARDSTKGNKKTNKLKNLPGSLGPLPGRFWITPFVSAGGRAGVGVGFMDGAAERQRCTWPQIAMLPDCQPSACTLKCVLPG